MSAHVSKAVAATRTIAFDALFNFRDLGGYPTEGGSTTRWGVLYRSDGLHRATARDLDLLEAMGIATVVDLRTPFERTEDGSFDDVQTRIDYHHVPLFDDLTSERPDTDSNDYLLNLYLHIVTKKGDRVAEALHVIGASDQPLVFHCTAGKDRTGVISALVLAAVGVSDDIIAQDYALSHDAMAALIAWYRARRTNDGPAQVQATAAMNRLGAEAAWMHQTLGFIRAEYGSTAGYLRSIDIGEAELAALRRNFLD